MKFKAVAYVDEYVIDGENTGTFAGDDTHITYSPEDASTWPSFSIPTDEVTSITINRDTTLTQNRFLGWFFAAITAVLVIFTYMMSFAGQITNPEVNSITLIMGFFILGGFTTTVEYFTRESHDVIVVNIKTDNDEHHAVHGRRSNNEFVEACNELITSDLETVIVDKKLKSGFSELETAHLGDNNLSS
ncbi:hypothetical protein [Natranaeroarchaeum aerophilus]|uniref:Uncharacterized protein n=1 Tax=Natranaeroarchaeum aerophilus TaxID=2917711 RepID=A0AAE3K6H6_9EURY|nr:hypothetical protein [Natranaeroarchaeum aerophilus]MCL9814420.1 hypothetical protein [Natranaeroarchaeum aerophilus]